MADSPDSFDRRLVLPHTGEGRHALVVRENLGTDKLSSTAIQWRPVAGGGRESQQTLRVGRAPAVGATRPTPICYRRVSGQPSR